MFQTMLFTSNNMQVSLPVAVDSKISTDDTTCAGSQQESLECDLSPTCQPGFQLDCWDQVDTVPVLSKLLPLHHTNDSADASTSESSLDDDDDSVCSDIASRWGFSGNSPLYVDESQHVRSSSSNDGDDHELEGTEDRIPSPPFCENANNDPLPNYSSSSGRHVHFDQCIEEYSYEKPSVEDFCRLYYSAHELQRLQDQFRIDLSMTTPGLEETETDDIDYCEDYPSW
jgi:hypothetical protein